MTAIDERIATQQAKAAQLTAARTNTTSPYGQQLEAVKGSTQYPTTYGTNTDGEDVDQLSVAHDARIQQEIERKREEASTFSSLEEARKAAELLTAKAGEWDEDRLATGWKRVKKFVAQHPQEVAEFKRIDGIRKWKEANIDTSPTAHSRLIKAQNESTQRGYGTEKPGRSEGEGIYVNRTAVPQSLEDLPKVPGDSYEGVIDQLERDGVDTTSGIGGFWDNVGLAIKLNDSTAQAKAITGIALDNLEEAGIVLPEGVMPITVNSEVGKLEVLMPTEDGKVRRTLVEPEVFNLASAGRLADLEELMAGVYAATAVIRGGQGAKHPFVRELVGDFAGRNVGIMLESIISGVQGEADLNDIVNAFDKSKNVTESGLNTVISRGIARTGRVLAGANKSYQAKYARGTETEAVIENNIDEAAQTLEDVNKLIGDSDKALPFTVEAGSLSEKGGQQINARVNRMNVGHAEALEATRRERVRSLGEANRRVAEKHSPGDAMSYDPHEVIESATGTVNTARRLEMEYQRSKLDQVSINHYADTNVTSFTMREEVDAATHAKGEIRGAHGIDVVFGDDNVHVVNAFAGENFGAAGMQKLWHRVLQEAGDRPITLGDSVSPSARKAVEGMRRRGWDIVENPGVHKAENGTWTAQSVWDGEGAQGVYTVVARPGEIRAPQLIADATFDKELTEATIDGVQELLPIAQTRVDDANYLLKKQIGWSEQRQTSNFVVDNKPTSGLQQQIRKLENRQAQVLTGVEASEADKKLAIAVQRTIDEDGDAVLSGLVNPQLDIGNLLNSRSRLNQIALETGDPDVARIVKTIDNLLANQPYINKATGRAVPAQTAGIRESFERARTYQAEAEEIAGVVNASRLFKRNVDGKLVNTDLNAMGRMLANGTAFQQHLLPVLSRGPDLAAGARGAISELYQKEVMDTGAGWTAKSHQSFLRKYGTAIDTLYGKEEQAIWKTFRPTPGATLNRAERASKAMDWKWERLVNKYAPDAEVTRFSNPRDIVASVNNMDKGKAAGFMQELERLNPELHVQVRQTAIDQTEKSLHRTFFDVDRDIKGLQSGGQMRKWFDDNKDSLRAIHGTQYVTDLETVVRGAELDAKRMRLQGTAPPTQHDMIRVTRSLLGPLSRPQRQITAGNYINNKRLAARVMKIYSDPDMLRALKQSKGMNVRTDAGIALFVRLGLAEAVGIPSPENVNRPDTWSPEFRQQVAGIYSAIDFWSEDAARENLE